MTSPMWNTKQIPANEQTKTWIQQNGRGDEDEDEEDQIHDDGRLSLGQ